MAGANLAAKWNSLQAALADRDLSPCSKVIYALLLDHHGENVDPCSPSYNQLARAAGISRRSAVRAVGELRRRGWVSAAPADGACE